jgi:hypothetical protein
MTRQMDKRTYYSPAQAISDQEFEAKLVEFISAVQVPESDRTAWYEKARRYSREPHRSENYDYARIAGKWIQATHLCWVSYPPQEEE